MRRTVPVVLAILVLLTPTLSSAQEDGEAQEKAEELLAAAEKEAGLPGIAKKVEGMERHEGLLTFFADADAGKVWLLLPPPGDGGALGTYLYMEGLLTGLGSNPVGLDRGQLGEGRVVTLRRVGQRLLVEEQNLRYRAVSDDPAERLAVRQSFATSVLWGGEVAARDPDGSTLVDFTGFLLRDAHGVATTLKNTGQGAFSLDPDRSAVDLEACLAFPDNLEWEAVLTWKSDAPGSEVQGTVPTPEAVTLVQHQSLVRLPDSGYVPRPFDPRAGSYEVTFSDYAVDLDEPLERRWLVRHRLEKVNPEAETSPAREPLVYYVDRGAPEPVRSALVEGASWWAEAFEAAGFEDAYRVELLPEGVHPLDVRYNVIQWVHRATRGWSYGGGIIDPRTGEMVKGHVWLGSLRVRQDRLLFEGLLGTEKTGTGAPDDPVELALARIRQLAAHEVGHTLGLSHNFAASTYGGRASVMDYPAPLVKVTPQGGLDLSEAYGVGVGSWDVFSVRYAYSQFAPGADEAAELDTMMRDALDRGLVFLTDHDARPPGAAHPLANLWDNGEEPVAALEEALAVRRIALARFGPGNVAPGRPLALLEEVLAPVYFHHRYQLEAAVKVVGGVTYRYALAGDGQPPVTPVPAAEQRRALEVVLGSLDPAALDLPEAVLAVVAPRPPAYPPNREQIAGGTDPVFDPLAAAATAAGMAVEGLLQPERAARLVDLHRRDPALPGLEEVLESLVETAFGGGAPAGPRLAEVARGVQWVVADGLLDLAGNPKAAPGVRARAEASLRALAGRLDPAAVADSAERAHRELLRADIQRFLDRGRTLEEEIPGPAPLPPGSPIGTASQVPAHALGACSWGDVR